MRTAICFVALAIATYAHEEVAYIPRVSARDDVDRSHLFKRQSNSYPAQLQKGPQPQQSWINAYNTAKAAGRLPDAPVASTAGSYPAGTNTGANGICSWSATQCTGTDIVAGPPGTIGVAFDDGPGPSTTGLYAFLQQQDINATHFMIGSTILANPTGFQAAVAMGGQIAVHTWSHPQMTTMTDMQVLGELGWTMQLIYDMSGLMPNIWRPPYGDVDNRVRAIASQVFGLTTVIWGHDSFDWCLNDAGTASNCGPQLGGPSNEQGLINSINVWINGPKTPGLIMLEHELTSASANAFMAVYPNMLSQGWKPLEIGALFGNSRYQNTGNRTTDPTQSMTVAQVVPYTMTSTSSATPTSSSTSSRISSTSSTSSATKSGAAANAANQDAGATGHKNSSISLGAIIGAAVGGAAVLLALVILLCCARRRGWCCFTKPRRRGLYNDDDAFAANSDANLMTGARGGKRSELEKPLHASDTSLADRGSKAGWDSSYTLASMSASDRPSSSRVNSYHDVPYDQLSPQSAARSLPPGAGAPRYPSGIAPSPYSTYHHTSPPRSSQASSGFVEVQQRQSPRRSSGTTEGRQYRSSRQSRGVNEQQQLLSGA